MTQVEEISTLEHQCQLNFGWGTPELVAAADLIEDYWNNLLCSGPTSPVPGERARGTGSCKLLFQNWLAQNPYYVVSLATTRMASNNWGAAATNSTLYIADYLWDRPTLQLRHRNPPRSTVARTPSSPPRRPTPSSATSPWSACACTRSVGPRMAATTSRTLAR